MAYCGPRGIPLSVFLSWRDDDQEAALAWQSYENRRCNDCGTHPEDWDETEEGGDRNAWRVQLSHCQGCAELQQAMDSDQTKRRGVHLHLTR